MSSRIYLDNAATSWPKPDSVYEAVDNYQRQNGAASGRGNYDSAGDSARIVTQARTAVKRLIGAEAESDCVFTFNGTDSLNLCLFGFLRHGDHVITTAAEHNSILRPLAHLTETRNVQVSYIDTDGDGVVSPDAVRSAMCPETKLIAITHASNVTGAIQPINDMGEIAHSANAKLLIDAAQTLGHVDLDVAHQPIDMLASSGHKGLMGPLGTGLVYLASGIGESVIPFRFGGTGINSQSDQQPSEGPERFESGNLNMPGIAGLHAAAMFHSAEPSTNPAFMGTVLEQLSSVESVRIIGPNAPEKRVGLVSFNVDGYDSHEVAALLNSEARIEVRAGLHCAPRMHERLGIPGSVRVSWGHFTTMSDIDTFLQVVTAIAGS